MHLLLNASLRHARGAFLALATVAAAAAPPAAPSEPAADVHHGIEVADPYRNLEDVKNPATLAWLQAQGAFAAEALSRIEGRDALASRIAALAQATGDQVRWVTRMPGHRVYYLRRKVGEDQFSLVMRVGMNGSDRVLVDPQSLAGASGTPHAINYYSPSWDGRTLAYGVSAGGSEDASLHLMDIATGKPLREPIPRVQQAAVHWTPDSRHVTYNQLRLLPPGAPPTETYLDTTVYRLDARDPKAEPRPLFGPLVNPELKLDRLDVAEVFFAPGSPYMIARTTDTTVPEGKLFVGALAALKDKSIAWRPIADASARITDAKLRGSTLYVSTTAGAPLGQVLAVPLKPLKSAPLARATVAVPQAADGVLKDFALGPGDQMLYAEVQRGFTTRVLRHGPGLPRQGRDVAPSLAGSTYRVADPARAHRDVWVTTSTWTEPPRLLAVAADGGVRDTGLRDSRLPPGTPELEVHEVQVPSHDGAMVPLAVIHRRGLPKDGRNPTLLVGYGAYGFSFEAWFDARSVAWLERGGVMALVNPRGSGAYGDPWHRAGFKASKPNTWKDGVAAARWLIDRKFASPRTLGVWGGSAGGIFAGRAMTSAPELFAAAILEVGVLDTVRYETTANGITNISEFGTVADPVEFEGLRAMSTYGHISPGVDYPAVLLVHGLNDPRVDVWQSAKVAARMQAANPGGRPVLLRLDAEAGHGVGSTARQVDAKTADIYSFLLWQFGTAAARP